MTFMHPKTSFQIKISNLKGHVKIGVQDATPYMVFNVTYSICEGPKLDA
jgi:hypothetical protein